MSETEHGLEAAGPDLSASMILLAVEFMDALKVKKRTTPARRINTPLADDDFAVAGRVSETGLDLVLKE
jgi:hypothetical protein